MRDKILICSAIATIGAAIYGYTLNYNNEIILLWLIATILLLGITVVVRGVRFGKEFRSKQKLEEELAEQNQLYQKQLLEAKELGKEELSSFCNSLSHTLRMPLSIVRGYAELLEGGIVTDRQIEEEYLKKILQHTKYISETISSNLQIVRSDTSTGIVCTQVDIVDMAERMAQDMRPSAQSSGITINVVCAEEKINIYADVYQLTRMFLNILENAIKYMGREGMIAIIITKINDNVSIMFKDDGVGLPEKELSNIFDDKYCGSNSIDGSGHGLFIVKNVVLAHSGTIDAKSGLGQGMGISITLPTNHPTAVTSTTKDTATAIK